MPVLDGIQATGEIAATRGLEGVRVLILTTYDTDAYVFEALQAGASGPHAQGRRPGRSAARHPGWWPPARRCWRPGSPGA
jgi:DNA-binding NarL/FixJ family response regulator